MFRRHKTLDACLKTNSGELSDLLITRGEYKLKGWELCKPMARNSVAVVLNRESVAYCVASGVRDQSTVRLNMAHNSSILSDKVTRSGCKTDLVIVLDEDDVVQRTVVIDH